ncbi:Crp/Fnr family transcriptional regulator [Sphingobium sp. LB126]|uniref:Crp/Fnr family transcriptional regulator n=2 Tax=Sphingomonadaceae TaxID=41297 RepID=UPI001F5B0C7A|nr:Crp/Fnr family transcriptional regulator [Sphingobium sp. LB126]
MSGALFRSHDTGCRKSSGPDPITSPHSGQSIAIPQPLFSARRFSFQPQPESSIVEGFEVALAQTAPLLRTRSYKEAMIARNPVSADPISGIALFTALPPDVRAQAVAIARKRDIPRDVRVFDQGQPAGRAHALLSGSVRITQSGSDGGEILVRFIGPGEIFGCVPLLTDGLYPADATTMVDSIEISWSPVDLLELMRQHSTIAINMTAILGTRLSEAQERLRELATQNVDRRIARALLRLADQAGRRMNDGIRIEFPLRRKDIADIAGTTLHTASRVVAGWERRGLIASHNQQLVLLSLDKIREIADGAAGH